MSPVNPMMIAAQIGPTPTISVSVVPDAVTALVTRFFDAFNAVSSRAMSSTSSVAIRTR
jgi:hypothetical protein